MHIISNAADGSTKDMINSFTAMSFAVEISGYMIQIAIGFAEIRKDE